MTYVQISGLWEWLNFCVENKLKVQLGSDAAGPFYILYLIADIDQKNIFILYHYLTSMFNSIEEDTQQRQCSFYFLCMFNDMQQKLNLHIV